MTKTIVLSINTSWNLINFRSHLIARLQREGFDVVAVSPADAHRDSLIALGVRHIAIDIDSKGISPLRDLKLLAQYVRILGEVRPVAFLGWTIKPNVYGSIASRLVGVPAIANISGLGTAFIKVNLLTRLVKSLYRFALARSVVVFFQNPHDRDLFVGQKLVARDQCLLLPGSGIDLSYFTPRQDESDGPFVFLMVARLLRDKGVLEFVEAARIVRAVRPDVRFHLLGATGAQNRTAIGPGLLAEWEREAVVDYLGETADVRPYLAVASVVVLPSYREGMPRSLLEASAMARPLIATDVPGCTEIARDGDNAILCPPRDAQALADAMLRMLALPTGTRVEMGRRGRELAEAKFDQAIIETHYLQAIARTDGAQRPH